MLARAQLPLLMLTTPYARPQGMASDQFNQLPRRAAWIAILAASLGSILVAGWMGLVMALAALACFLIARRAMLQRISGFTGDTAGALVEITETLLLLVCVIRL
jgi:adenosylcobinamide-GDP ribazoletransferase